MLRSTCAFNVDSDQPSNQHSLIGQRLHCLHEEASGPWQPMARWSDSASVDAICKDCFVIANFIMVIYGNLW